MMQWRGEISTQQLVWRLVPIFLLALLLKDWLADRLRGKWSDYELPAQGQEFLRSVVMGHAVASIVALSVAGVLAAFVVRHTLANVDIYKDGTSQPTKENLLGKIWSVLGGLCFLWVMIRPFWIGYETLIFRGSSAMEIVETSFKFTKSLSFPYLLATWATLLAPLFLMSRTDKTHFLPKSPAMQNGDES